MIDVHAHFAGEGYSFPEEWERIRAAGVSVVILAGDTVAHSAWHKEFAESHEGAYFTAGVHPSELENLSCDRLKEIEALARHPKCVGVGEIGLDYHYENTDKEAQKAAFLAQLELADSLSLPVQLHSRDCAADMLALLKEHASLLKHGFLMHCYSHGKEMMGEFAALGAYFSFGGTVCFKNGRRTVESAAACPEERLLTETDSPYLSPFRGEKNSPANIPVIVRRLAEVRGADEEHIKAVVRRNAETLFHKLAES